MADANKILRSLLAKAYKMQDSEIDQLLDDQTTDGDAVKQVTELDKTRIIEIKKTTTGKSYDDGVKKGKSEKEAELEAEIKSKYEIDSEAKGLDLLDEVITTKAKAGKPKDLTDEDVKKHPAFIAAEKAHKKAITETATQWETKLKQIETDNKKGAVWQDLSKSLLEELGQLKPVLSPNAKVAANAQTNFLNAIKGAYEFERNEAGDTIVMKDGKVATDAHGNRVEYKDLVKTYAPDYFDFQANNGGSNGGNGKTKDETGGSGGGAAGAVYPASIKKPTTYQEYEKIVNNYEIPVADRIVVRDTWEKEQTQGTNN